MPFRHKDSNFEVQMYIIFFIIFALNKDIFKSNNQIMHTGPEKRRNTYDIWWMFLKFEYLCNLLSIYYLKVVSSKYIVFHSLREYECNVFNVVNNHTY